MVPRGVPPGLDPATSRQIQRTFLVVRLVRGSVLLLFLAIALVGVELRGWPTGVMVAIALAMLVQAGALAVWGRRYVTAGQDSRRGR